jgi:hypothetical protein
MKNNISGPKLLKIPDIFFKKYPGNVSDPVYASGGSDLID